MARITFIIEDTSENAVSIGGVFPKDTDPNALTMAERLAYLIGMLTEVVNKQPQFFDWLMAVAQEASDGSGEVTVGTMSSEDFHAGITKRQAGRWRRMPRLKRRTDN